MSAFTRFDPWQALDKAPDRPLHASAHAHPKDAPVPLVSRVIEPGQSSPRREWADDLLRRLHAGICYQSPAGLGFWPQTWEIVAKPSTRLLDVLQDWERTGEEGDKRAAVWWAEEVAIAWERAANAWDAAGRPGAQRVA